MEHKESGFLSLGPRGFHRIAYTQWGNGHNKRVVVCVHGATRNGRDFDELAQDLSYDFRVACPDLVGRGHSHWLTDPADYALPVYIADMAAMIVRMGVEQVDWVGTSLGGLIGMVLAAQPNSPINSLVINDIGPFVPHEALKPIAEYVALNESFADFDALKTHLMYIHAPFGKLTDQQWDHLARHSGRQNEDGTWVQHYDPAIAINFKKSATEDIDLWQVWEAIRCPVLILRGEDSEVLPRAVAEEMLERGPAADLVEFPDAGHAPALVDEFQVDAVRHWLMSKGQD